MSDGLLDSTTEHLLRELAPQVLGVIVRRFHDFAERRGCRPGGADRGSVSMAQGRRA